MKKLFCLGKTTYSSGNLFVASNSRYTWHFPDFTKILKARNIRLFVICRKEKSSVAIKYFHRDNWSKYIWWLVLNTERLFLRLFWPLLKKHQFLRKHGYQQKFVLSQNEQNMWSIEQRFWTTGTWRPFNRDLWLRKSPGLSRIQGHISN